MRRISEGRPGSRARLKRLLVFGKKSQNLVDEDFEYPTFKRASVLKPRWIARRRDPAVFDGFSARSGSRRSCLLPGPLSANGFLHPSLLALRNQRIGLSDNRVTRQVPSVAWQTSTETTQLPLGLPCEKAHFVETTSAGGINTKSHRCWY